MEATTRVRTAGRPDFRCSRLLLALALTGLVATARAGERSAPEASDPRCLAAQTAAEVPDAAGIVRRLRSAVQGVVLRAAPNTHATALPAVLPAGAELYHCPLPTDATNAWRYVRAGGLWGWVGAALTHSGEAARPLRPTGPAPVGPLRRTPACRVVEVTWTGEGGGAGRRCEGLVCTSPGGTAPRTLPAASGETEPTGRIRVRRGDRTFDVPRARVRDVGRTVVAPDRTFDQVVWPATVSTLAQLGFLLDDDGACGRREGATLGGPDTSRTVLLPGDEVLVSLVRDGWFYAETLDGHEGWLDGRALSFAGIAPPAAATAGATESPGSDRPVARGPVVRAPRFDALRDDLFRLPRKAPTDVGAVDSWGLASVREPHGGRSAAPEPPAPAPAVLVSVESPSEVVLLAPHTKVLAPCAAAPTVTLVAGAGVSVPPPAAPSRPRGRLVLQPRGGRPYRIGWCDDCEVRVAPVRGRSPLQATVGWDPLRRDFVLVSRGDAALRLDDATEARSEARVPVDRSLAVFLDFGPTGGLRRFTLQHDATTPTCAVPDDRARAAIPVVYLGRRWYADRSDLALDDALPVVRLRRGPLPGTACRESPAPKRDPSDATTTTTRPAPLTVAAGSGGVWLGDALPGGGLVVGASVTADLAPELVGIVGVDAVLRAGGAGILTTTGVGWRRPLGRIQPTLGLAVRVASLSDPDVVTLGGAALLDVELALTDRLHLSLRGTLGVCGAPTGGGGPRLAGSVAALLTVPFLR